MNVWNRKLYVSPVIGLWFYGIKTNSHEWQRIEKTNVLICRSKILSQVTYFDQCYSNTLFLVRRQKQSKFFKWRDNNLIDKESYNSAQSIPSRVYSRNINKILNFERLSFWNEKHNHFLYVPRSNKMNELMKMTKYIQLSCIYSVPFWTKATHGLIADMPNVPKVFRSGIRLKQYWSNG